MRNTKELMHCHCDTNNRSPRWTFTDPWQSLTVQNFTFTASAVQLYFHCKNSPSSLTVQNSTFTASRFVSKRCINLKNSRICSRLLSTDMCIGLYVCLLNVGVLSKKGVSMQRGFEEVLEKQRWLELKSIGNSEAKTVCGKYKSVFIGHSKGRTIISMPYRPTNCLSNT